MSIWVSVPTGDFSFIYRSKNPQNMCDISFRPHRGLFFYLSQGDVQNVKKIQFPSPPGTFLLSMREKNITRTFMITVSVPTGDFSFIYDSSASRMKIRLRQFPSPPGTFLLSIWKRHCYSQRIASFPSPPGTFLLSIKVKSFILREWFPSFRPHRGLFFYLYATDFLNDVIYRVFPSPPGTFLLSMD